MANSTTRVDKVHIKLAIDRGYAEKVFPWLKKVFMKATTSSLFQLALSLLVYHAEVLEKGHELVEVDKDGKIIGVIRIPEYIASKVAGKLTENSNHSTS